MLTPSTGAVRFGRALLWAAVVVALSAAAHLRADGHLPPGEILAALAALTLAATSVAARRQIRLPAGLALVGLAQVVFHQVFAFLAGAGCTASLAAVRTLPGGPTVDAGGGHLAGHGGGAVLTTGACHAPPTELLDPAMAGWHAVATVAAVALLVGVERGVWWLATWWVRPLSLVVVPLTTPPAVPFVAARPVVARSADLGVAPSRGPPCGALTSAFALAA